MSHKSAQPSSADKYSMEYCTQKKQKKKQELLKSTSPSLMGSKFNDAQNADGITESSNVLYKTERHRFQQILDE